MTTLSSRELLHILGRGVLSALLFHGFSTGKPIWIFLGFLHQFPLFSIGLQYGLRSLMIGAGISFSCVSLMSGPFQGISQTLFFLSPCVLVTALALRHRELSSQEIKWYPIGRIVAVLTLYILVLTAGISSFLLSSGNLHMLQQELVQEIGRFNPQVQALYQPFMSQIVSILPALLGAVIMLLTLINSAIAQATLEKYKRNLRPTSSMAHFELPWWPWWVLVGVGVGALFAKDLLGHLSINLLWILFIAFMMEGLGIVHAYALKLQQQNLFLWIFYMLMVVFGWIALPIVILGIFEPWLNLKERLSKI